MSVQVKEGGGVFSDINITPLTDIFLVLLIIFMVTTAVTIESAAHVDLPKAQQTQPNQKPKGVTVAYTSQGNLFVNGQSVTYQGLPASIHAALQSKPDKLVIFTGDPKVVLGDMVRILDIAKTAGADQIAIAVAALPANGATGGAPPAGPPGAGGG